MIGLLTPRFRGASLAMKGFGTNAVGVVAGATVEIGALAYDTLVADSDGFTTGHGLADGKLIVPPGMGGLYRVRAVIELGGWSGVGEIRASCGITYTGGEYRETQSPTRPATAPANPLLNADVEHDVVLAPGNLVNVNCRVGSGPAGNYNIYVYLFALHYLRRV